MVWNVNKKKFLIFLFFSLCFAPKAYSLTEGASKDGIRLASKDGPAKVIVDCSKKLGEFTNIAPGINFWGGKEAQERFMSEVGTGLYRITIILDDIRKEGKRFVNFPWEVLEEAELRAFRTNIGKAKAKGGKIMVEIRGVPKWLSRVPNDERIATNRRPNFSKYPPRDYEEWKRLVSTTVEKMRNLGFDPDYYQVLAEQNVGSTWYQQGIAVARKDGKLVREPNRLNHKTRRIIKEYCEFYESTVKGIRSIDSTAKISGINFTPNMSALFWARFVARYARRKGLSLDFYSLHKYDAGKNLVSFMKKRQSLSEKGRKTIDVIKDRFAGRLQLQGFSTEETERFINDAFTFVSQIDDNAVKYPFSYYVSQMDKILQAEGFDKDELEVFITEWNTGPNGDARRDTTYCASFVVKSLIDMTNAKIDGQSFYSLWGWDRKPGDSRFGKGTAYLFVPGKTGVVPKPSFNAFKLFAKLDGRRVYLQSSEDSLYGIATASDKAVMTIVTLFTRSQAPKYDVWTNLELVLKNVPFKRYEYKIWLVDKEHANGYLGQDPELHSVGSGFGVGDFAKSIRLSAYGTVMTLLEKVVDK